MFQFHAGSIKGDISAAAFYNGLAPELQATARVVLRSMFEAAATVQATPETKEEA